MTSVLDVKPHVISFIWFVCLLKSLIILIGVLDVINH